MANVHFRCRISGYEWLASDNAGNMPSCPIHRRKNCMERVKDNRDNSVSTPHPMA